MIRILLSLTLSLAYSATLSQKQRPNIVWIVCEDISPFLGAYGNTEVHTPNIDQLAREGIRYTHAYSVAGVCAPSRSALITGMYPTSIGTQHMRTNGNRKYQPVPPYSAVLPEEVKCFPEYLRKVGYYCTNNTKQDYQFEAPVTVWDENSITATFLNRVEGAPFFSVFNLAVTHESQLFSRTDSLTIDPAHVTVPPIYPDCEATRHDIARLFTNIGIMDGHVGDIVRLLKKFGLYENTIIFFYSDHGGALPWMKREVLERGTNIPLIIRFPGGRDGGTTNDDLISNVDFAATVLSLADVAIPAYMQGQAFLGSQESKLPRKYVFAARDRMDNEYDRVRMVRDKKFRYIHNYMPEKTSYQNSEYRLGIPMMREILKLKEEGKLDAIQRSWFLPKPLEELYDVEADPYETKNLVTDSMPPYQLEKLAELRTAFQEWTRKYGDQSSIPEKEMIRRMWNGKGRAPSTAKPEIIPFRGNGVRLSCDTKGASIGYRIAKKKAEPWHVAWTWDFESLSGRIQNGAKAQPPPTWLIYDGEIIPLQPGDSLYVNAMRIGYKAAEVAYRQKPE